MQSFQKFGVGFFKINNKENKLNLKIIMMWKIVEAPKLMWHNIRKSKNSQMSSILYYISR